MSRLNFTKTARSLAQAIAVLAALGAPANAQFTCDRQGCGAIFAVPPITCNATPATPTPSSLWGTLTPVTDLNGSPLAITRCVGSTGQPSPPDCRDSSGFNEFQQTYASYPMFTGVDIENGYALVSYSHGLGVWDLRTTPETPVLLGKAHQSAFPFWTAGEEKWPIRSVDAPAGIDTVAIVGGGGGFGAAVLNLANKNSPTVKYQFKEKIVEEVYAATIGGRHYGFVAANSATAGFQGLYALDMTSALALGTYCNEDETSLQCGGGVYKGRIGAVNGAAYVTGLDNYLVVSHGSSPGFEIYDISNIASCSGGSCTAVQQKLSGLTDKGVHGVALWKQSSTYYLGARLEYWDAGAQAMRRELRIYDVSCISTTCGSLPAPLVTKTLSITTGTSYYFLTFSRSGTTPFLYLGSDNRCGIPTEHREWLFNVSTPSNPVDVTPTPTIQASAIYSGVTQTYSVDYWGWYYRPNPTGFNYVGPRRGKFQNNLFYRAAFSLFDFHSWGTAGPVAPTVASVTASPNPALQCGLVTLTANGVTGSPTPSLSWEVRSPSNQLVTSGSGVNPFSWQTGPTTSPGIYTGTATAQNSAGSDAKSTSITINSPPTLAFLGAPTADTPAGTVVQFHVQSQGATEWAWDFGDNTPLNWTSDPTSGPNPAHTYPGIGTYNVTAYIRNCGAGPITSSTIQVQVTSSCSGFGITKFLATVGSNMTCTAGFGCVVDAGAITFDEQVACGPTYYDYDWNGDGIYEDWGNTSAILNRSFFVPGNYQTTMRIRKDAQSATAIHGFPSGTLIMRVFEGVNPFTSLPPTAPTSLSATVLSESSIRLNWTDTSTFENLFHVMMSVNGGAYSEIQVLRPNVTVLTLVGLTPSTPYSFKIRASNDAGYSSYTAVASGTTQASVPAAPTSVAAATLSSSSVRLTWVDNSNNETSFRVEARTGAAAFAEVASFAANTTTGDVTGLSPNTAYDFRMRSANGQGFSGYTSTVSATTLPLPPAAPIDLAATPISHGWIRLDWADVATNETDYRVEMKVGTGPYSEVLTLEPDATRAEITGLTPLTGYTFRVRASNAGGFSAYSGEAPASTPANTELFLSGLEATGSFGLPGGWSEVYPGPPS